ncbi:MAG: helix-turn-helix transcriptional regulator, partial [Acetatifactor sp.]|nr:helix-turn-helix transcriptional regulator [Acetatifactor sp.]
MNYREQLQCALDYIEDNLCQDLDLDRIAASTGYSKYHFLRIFKAELGMTPGEYIR